jgi:hypothetical protein
MRYSKTNSRRITMKKTLLLSVVASTMIMAGGDIAPVEPVVETPMVAATSGWDFSGQAVAYTQTVDQSGNGDLFGSESTYTGTGVQLRAVNKDIFGGIGAGVEVSTISSDSNPGFYTGGGNAGTTSAGFTQAYLTYGVGNTSVKVGRQTLPKSLSPFAYSEGWQMFKNTFDAALVVNSDLPDTTAVYAYVTKRNKSVGNYLDISAFAKFNGDDGAHMVTLQNKSIEGVTLTGTYYTLPDAADILWADVKTKVAGLSLALQGGQIDPDVGDASTAFGVKVGTSFSGVNLSAAYSSVSEDGGQFSNLTGVKSPLYTQMVLNNVGQYHAKAGSEFIKLFATTKALGGTVKAGYGIGTNTINDNTDYSEFDLMYVTKLTANTKLFTAYVLTNDDDAATGPKDNNFVRVWARYSF